LFFVCFSFCFFCFFFFFFSFQITLLAEINTCKKNRSDGKKGLAEESIATENDMHLSQQMKKFSLFCLPPQFCGCEKRKSLRVKGPLIFLFL